MPLSIINPDIYVNLLRFAGGEMHVQLDKLPEKAPGQIDIRADLYSSDDVMSLLLVHDALQNHYESKSLINLEIPYFPYARQDRVCAVGQAFSLQIMSKLINDLNVNSLTVWDVHSPVTQNLTGAKNISQKVIINSSKKLSDYLQEENTVLVCPDAGAKQKCEAVKNKFSVEEMIYSEKLRNPASGEIIDTKLIAGKLKNKTAIIIDDICDGGRTFIEIAKKLKEKNIGRVILYVTHGIFSNGLEVFDGLIDEIYTTNSFPQVENSKLTVIDFKSANDA